MTSTEPYSKVIRCVMTSTKTPELRYLMRYVMTSTGLQLELDNPKDHEKDLKVPSLRYINVPKKTLRKTLITYIFSTYLKLFSPVPKKTHFFWSGSNS